MPYILTKFFEKKSYQEDFIKGNFYLSSLATFTKTYAERGLMEAAAQGDRYAREILKKQRNKSQRDVLEGTIASIPPSRAKEFPADMRSVMCTDMMIRALGYDYCNVMCFCKMEYRQQIVKGKMSIAWHESNMKDFGEYAIIVKNPKEFIRRLDKAISNKNYQYICGDVNYHPMTLNNKPVNNKHSKDIVETVFIYNAYCDGKGLLMGNPVGGGKDKVEDKKFDENSARFWEKVLEIEEKLNLNFIPPKDDIEFETICMVEQLYQNLICKKPIKKRDIATSITSDMNMREGINLDDLIGKQIFFQYNATTTFELFEMQFSLPSIVGIFNSIFESYEILDNKTKVILGTKDKGQKPFTAILCFASDSDMNEYVKENPDCYENILSKAKFPQDYLE